MNIYYEHAIPAEAVADSIPSIRADHQNKLCLINYFNMSQSFQIYITDPFVTKAKLLFTDKTMTFGIFIYV